MDDKGLVVHQKDKGPDNDHFQEGWRKSPLVNRAPAKGKPPTGYGAWWPSIDTATERSQNWLRAGNLGLHLSRCNTSGLSPPPSVSRGRLEREQRWAASGCRSFGLREISRIEALSFTFPPNTFKKKKVDRKWRGAEMFRASAWRPDGGSK